MAIHEGDLVTVRGRPGVWRVLRVRRGTARLGAVAGPDGVTGTTVAVGLLEPWDQDD